MPNSDRRSGFARLMRRLRIFLLRRDPTFIALVKVYQAALASPSSTPFSPDEDARVDRIVAGLAARHRLSDTAVRMLVLDPTSPSILSLVQNAMQRLASAVVSLFR